MNSNNETMFNPNASYLDLVGKSQLAWDDEHTALENIGKAARIDIKLYTVVGLSIHISSHFFALSLFIARTEANDNGKQSIFKISTDITQGQFQKLLKEYTSNVFLPYEKWEDYEYKGEERISNLR